MLYMFVSLHDCPSLYLLFFFFIYHLLIHTFLSPQVKRTKVKGSEDKKEMKGVRDDIDEEDDEESYYRYIQENPNAGR